MRLAHRANAHGLPQGRRVAVGVAVNALVGLGVRVGVGVAMRVSVGMAVLVLVGTGVCVGGGGGSGVLVGVAVGVRVSVGVGVTVGVSVGMRDTQGKYTVWASENVATTRTQDATKTTLAKSSAFADFMWLPIYCQPPTGNRRLSLFRQLFLFFVNQHTAQDFADHGLR